MQYVGIEDCKSACTTLPAFLPKLISALGSSNRMVGSMIRSHAAFLTAAGGILSLRVRYGTRFMYATSANESPKGRIEDSAEIPPLHYRNERLIDCLESSGRIVGCGCLKLFKQRIESERMP